MFVSGRRFGRETVENSFFSFWKGGGKRKKKNEANFCFRKVSPLASSSSSFHPSFFPQGLSVALLWNSRGIGPFGTERSLLAVRAPSPFALSSFSREICPFQFLKDFSCSRTGSGRIKFYGSTRDHGGTGRHTRNGERNILWARFFVGGAPNRLCPSGRRSPRTLHRFPFVRYYSMIVRNIIQSCQFCWRVLQMHFRQIKRKTQKCRVWMEGGFL